MTEIKCIACERTKVIGAVITTKPQLDLFVEERLISCDSAFCRATAFALVG